MEEEDSALQVSVVPGPDAPVVQRLKIEATKMYLTESWNSMFEKCKERDARSKAFEQELKQTKMSWKERKS